PSKVDKLLNDVIGTITRDKFGMNAGVRASQAWRNNIYRATLGLNVSSAVRNLTQATNTFAELGTRDTVAGYAKLVRALGESGRSKLRGGKPSELLQELIDEDIVGDAIHRQDEVTSALKQTMERVDQGLWAMFDTAELL